MDSADRPLQGEGDRRRWGRAPQARSLIVTADDFGASPAVNEAVERAHRSGILSCASLMVAGDAAADAVARAKRLPALGVGLHLVLVEGRPVLPATEVPDLIDASGHSRTDMARAGVNFLRPGVRRQLEAEIAAQFAAFAATGLPRAHGNPHNQFHHHPMIAALVLKIGRRHGLKAARAPVEPDAVLRRIEPVRRSLADRIAAPYARALARRFRRAGVAVPDQVFGLAWTGHMTTARVAALIAHLPVGTSELYVHPATDDDWPGHAPGYDYTGELAALVAPEVRTAIEAGGVRLIRFADMGDGRTGA